MTNGSSSSLTSNQRKLRPGNAQAAKKAADAIFKLRNHGIVINSTTTVLDYGCAEGLLSQNLISSVQRVFGIDISSERVNKYNSMVYNQGIDAEEMNAICVDLLNDCDDSLYRAVESDLVIACSVYHHIEDISLLTCRLRRCVKPGGWLIIIDMLKNQDTGQLHIDSNEDVVKHHGGFTIELLLNIFKQAKLTDLGHDIAFDFSQTSGGVKQSYQNFILWGMK